MYVLQIGGRDTEFQKNYTVDGLEILCQKHQSLKELQFEYCSRIGDESIQYVAERQTLLKKISVVRNFHQKSAKLSDASGISLSMCSSLHTIHIDYSRHLDHFCDHLDKLQHLTKL